MKVGRCPICRARMVLVAVSRCGCGSGHRQLAQLNTCTTPAVSYVVRAHECGRRLRPTDLRNLEGIPA